MSALRRKTGLELNMKTDYSMFGSKDQIACGLMVKVLTYEAKKRVFNILTKALQCP